MSWRWIFRYERGGRRLDHPNRFLYGQPPRSLVFPTADSDGDGFNNLSDPDDDADALDPRAPITRLRDLAVSISSVGWRQGFDLEDDDENQDGRRDVLCRYEYASSVSTASGVLWRTFCYDGVCEPSTVILTVACVNYL